MKKILCIVSAVLMAVAPFATAEEYQWLTFRLADDIVVAVAAEGLEMSYADGVLHLVSPTVNTSLQVDNLLSMQFSSDASSISEIEARLNGRAEYFTVSGISVGTFESVDAAREVLAGGVYIARRGDKCWKLMF